MDPSLTRQWRRGQSLDMCPGAPSAPSERCRSSAGDAPLGAVPSRRHAISLRSRITLPLPLALLGVGVLVWLAARLCAVFRVAFNWDEFVILHRAARSAAEGMLRGGGHGGLSELLLTPLVAACTDEIGVALHARLLWLGLSALLLAGVGALIWELLRERPERAHDTVLAVASLALLPVVLEWSLQVRSDHIAVAGGVWGGALLLMSRRRTALAAAAGVAFAIGWLSSQKLAYLALLTLCLELGTLLSARAWQPHRELLRAALLVGVAVAITSAYRLGIGQLLSIPESHPTAPLPNAAWVTGYLDLFDFYRKTLRYDEHLAVLPSALPHAVVFAGLMLASASALRRRRLDPHIALAWGTLALGIATALFHAAAFAYFWLTLGVFLAVAFALALAPVRGLLPLRWRAPVCGALWCAIALQGTLKSIELLEDTQEVQRESLRFVEHNFRPADPGFHPESGVFCGVQPMGTWLSQSIYQRVGAPEARRNVPRLIERFGEARIHYLVQSFRLNQFPLEVRRFFAEHYQPYRASVFVAGRQLSGVPGDRREFDLIIPGVYRWIPHEGPHSIRVDGAELAPGATLPLDASQHVAEFSEPVPGGALVLALREPPGPAPLAFYKTY